MLKEKQFMQRDYKLYLRDIIESIKKINSYKNNKSYEDLFKRDIITDAIIRNLEIIGEATKNIPSEIRNRYPNVEWKSISGLRDIITHKYFGINTEIIWDILCNRLPNLEKSIKEILRDLG